MNTVKALLKDLVKVLADAAKLAVGAACRLFGRAVKAAGELLKKLGRDLLDSKVKKSLGKHRSFLLIVALVAGLLAALSFAGLLLGRDA
ncbi:MAG: hypothetical protein IJT62_07895 [Oscillospiraceae bacterium]|nr:hypothetical protein [Oscillospiraceae bacterium]